MICEKTMAKQVTTTVTECVKPRRHMAALEHCIVMTSVAHRQRDI